MTEPLAVRSAEYYTRKLAEHGATPKGTDWNSLESQELRFRQLLRVSEGEPALDVNDYGCGYGALADYLERDGRPFNYGGYDAAPAMVAAARARFAGRPAYQFTAVRSELPPRDFTVASGIFNVRETTGDEAWWAYVTRTLADIASVSKKGFSSNFLTSYSDADRKRPDLFYPDPSDVLRYCLATFSRRAVILHDYPLYEFTVLVRL